jgi:hypothetical protein
MMVFLANGTRTRTLQESAGILIFDQSMGSFSIEVRTVSKITYTYGDKIHRE